jgi:hypothetical protein
MALKPHIKGDTYNGLCFTVTINGVALDLTDVEINAHFRLGSKTGCKVHKFSVGNGIEITDAVNGQFSLLENEIIDWEVGSWYFDIEFTYLSGKVKTYYSDILIIIQDVTK